jgi:hypothetical protein
MKTNKRKKNILTIMTVHTFKTYKKINGTIPRCVSCGKTILVGDKMMRLVGSRKTKYVCEECSKKDVIVFQYPMSKPANKLPNKLGGK